MNYSFHIELQKYVFQSYKEISECELKQPLI